MRKPAGVVAAVAFAGCGHASLAVPSSPHPDFALATLVDRAPPPARLENLESTPPAPGCRWLDGRWVWASRRWDWVPGGWIRPPVGCRYSAPEVTWGLSGERAVLYYRPGRWYSESEPRVCAEPASCLGAPVRLPVSSLPDR